MNTDQRFIRLRGVRVHNLKAIDLDLPTHRFTVLSGVSGSGKSSLAFDTLYAEGQRRYIETFSPYTRQFLERLDKPDADLIEDIPPAIGVGQRQGKRSGRSTVATITEIHDYLGLLFARAGQVVCRRCETKVDPADSSQVAKTLDLLPSGTRYLILIPVDIRPETDLPALFDSFRATGFTRVRLGGEIKRLDAMNEAHSIPPGTSLEIVVDRLTSGAESPGRRLDSLETAFAQGLGRCRVAVEGGETFTYYRGRRCPACGLDAPEPDPRLFRYDSPLGACRQCEGNGILTQPDLALIVPDRSKTLRNGAIAPWTVPDYRAEFDALLAAAPRLGIPLDQPFDQLTADHVALLLDGKPEANLTGIRPFLKRLAGKAHKAEIRTFLSRWQRSEVCAACHGTRLRDEARAVRLAGKDITQVLALNVEKAGEFLQNVAKDLVRTNVPVASILGATGGTPPVRVGDIEGHWWGTTSGTHERSNPSPTPIPGSFSEPYPKDASPVLRAIEPAITRLAFLQRVGLGYLTLDRPARTLSTGESRRVSLTTALGSGLVNTLYVLDEPSVGLHPRDVSRLVQAVQSLRDAGNTVVVVEHDEQFITSADHLVDIGPGAGEKGGRVVYQGPPSQVIHAADSATGRALAGGLNAAIPTERRKPTGKMILKGASGHNLKHVNATIPLGVLCVVTGVSGAGKTTLIEDTLFPAIEGRLTGGALATQPFESLEIEGRLDHVAMVDQSPIGRSARSNPATYIKVFDEIRKTFATTHEAKARKYGANTFSFNVDGGRCSNCEGNGQLVIDMQFLADVMMRCPDCRGKRYRAEVLEVEYRGKSIADVLDLTAREAFGFFRTKPKVQARLRPMIDVGLDYLRLGQPASTLSGGEAQRLRLASFLASTPGAITRAAFGPKTLFILDEPTTGLHPADTLKLIEALSSLLVPGHSVVVVEHSPELMLAADWIIDLGPEAGENGGRIVAEGTPEHVATQDCPTGHVLAKLLANRPREGSETRS